jgi:hypothetical protein
MQSEAREGAMSKFRKEGTKAIAMLQRLGKNIASIGGLLGSEVRSLERWCGT